MPEPVSYAAGVNAALSATKIIAKSTGEWRGWIPRQMQVAQFRRLVENNTVLGFSPSLKRKKYAITPVIQAMHNCDGEGAVSVAMVPPAQGKTTASMYFLRRNKSYVRGIAFCRARKGIPYVVEMLELLGLDTSKPPHGWLSCLIDALRFPSPGDTRRSYLILDEFVNETTDRVDSSLVETFKTYLRNTGIRVILLTPSEDYANLLLTLNDLEGIIPLYGTYPLDEYPNGQWQSMRWSVDTLKIAARQWHDFVEFTADRIDKEIDDYVASLSDDEAKKLSFLKGAINKKLVQKHPLQELDVAVSTSVDAEDPVCSNCTIM